MGEKKGVQAGSIVLQHSLLKIRGNHIVPAHVELSHLSGHHRLLPQQLVVLLFSEAHDVLDSENRVRYMRTRKS